MSMAAAPSASLFMATSANASEPGARAATKLSAPPTPPGPNRAPARARSRCAAAWACSASWASTACTGCATRWRCWTPRSAASSRRRRARAQLVQLHLARRPGARPSVGARAAGLRVRFQRSAFSKLIIMNGKNLVENKITDSHWFIECMERGAKIVVIAPEYGAALDQGRLLDSGPAGHRRGALAGRHRLMIDRKWYDVAFVKQFTDFPLLVRTDNLKRLRAHEVFPNYQSTLPADGPAGRCRASPTSSTPARRFRRLGRQVQRPRRSPATGGQKLSSRASTPSSIGTGKVKLADGSESRWPRSGRSTRRISRTTTSTPWPKSPAPKELIEQLAQDIAPSSRLDPPGRRHQPLVPRHRGQPRRLSAADADRQHRQAGRRLPHGWAGNYKAALFQGSN
jgi:nitrate reductase / nitrite oxidoreductase, alpha subunit